MAAYMQSISDSSPCCIDIHAWSSDIGAQTDYTVYYVYKQTYAESKTILPNVCMTHACVMVSIYRQHIFSRLLSQLGPMLLGQA